VGSVGVGAGVFEKVGSPHWWLQPVLWVLGRQGVVFPGWHRDVPFTVTNTPGDGTLAARRTFHFSGGDRSMVDLMSVQSGGLVDELGSGRRYRAELDSEIVDGAMSLFSTGMSLRVGRTHLRIPRWACPRVQITERWDDADSRQHVSVEITAPILGRVYEYSGSFIYSLEERNVPAS
jgi:hypothetical protein